MRIITEILHVEKKIAKNKKVYYKTTAIAGDDEVIGWSKSKDYYRVGDRVEVFHHDKYDETKMRKTRLSI